VKLWINYRGFNSSNNEAVCFNEGRWATGKPAVGLCIEKNWTPYVHGTTLRFLYKMHDTDPTVLELVDKDTGEVRVVTGNFDLTLKTRGFSGGSALIPWAHPYLAGVAHITRTEARPNQSAPMLVWRGIPMLFNVDTLRGYYAPEVTFPVPKADLAVNLFRKEKDVQYPYDLQVVDNGSAVRIGVEHNDRYPTWYTVGIADFDRLLPCVHGKKARK
jgi:hypothetical protein